VVLGTAIAAIVGLGALTWRQARVWRDTTSLWRQAVRATPDCVICQVNLGHQLLETGAPDSALQHFQRALERRPDRALSYRSLGLALEALGRREEAIDAYRGALALAPRDLGVRLSLATALLAAGRPDETVGVIEGARRFYAPAALAQFYAEVARRRPDAPVPRLGLVSAWRALGQREQAGAELEVLRRLHPGLAGAIVAGADPS
jgi:tetratricopeptide (TPR) repeat protein